MGNKTIRQVKSNDIQGEKELFLQIVTDMLEYAGVLRPAPNWDLDRGGQDGGEYFQEVVLDGGVAQVNTEYQFNEHHYEEHFSSLSRMMDPWVGCTGMGTVTPENVRPYIDYLYGIDHLGLMNEYFDIDGNMKEGRLPLMVTDLGSIMDANLITSLLDGEQELLIVEVGGGYGRLAEVFINIFGPERIKYVLVDAVPASLMYSELYMKDRFPDMNVGSYYRGDDFDLEKYSCYVIPAWHFERLNKYQFDACINIQSMQEMSQNHVDYYLNLFDKVVKNEGLIYLSNEKDYVFRGTWDFPQHWQKVFQDRTPRSWTRHSPTEMFLKKSGENFDRENQLIEFMYQKQLHGYDVLAKLKEKVIQSEAVMGMLESIKLQVQDVNSSVEGVNASVEGVSALVEGVNASVLLKWKKH